MRRILFVFTLCIIGNTAWPQAYSIGTSTSSSTAEVIQETDTYFENLLSADSSSENQRLFKFYNRWRSYWSSRSQADSVEGGSHEPMADFYTRLMNGTCNICNTSVDNKSWSFVGPTRQQTVKHRAGIVTSVVADPTDHATIYAGSNTAGLYKTVNGGQDWVSVTDQLRLPSLGINWVELHPDNPQTVYMATTNRTMADEHKSGYGIYKSTNGGQTWASILTNANGYGFDLNIQKIVFDPSNSNIIYAIGGLKFYKSTNGGASWTSTAFSGNPAFPNSLEFLTDLEIESSSNTIYISTKILASGGARLWKSVDAGVSFTEITSMGYPIFQNLQIEVTDSDPNYVYIGFSEAGGAFHLMKSLDEGSNWTDLGISTSGSELYFNFYRGQFEISDKNKDRVYFANCSVFRKDPGTSTMAVKTTGGCGSWSMDWHPDVRALRFLDQSGSEDKILAGNDGGVSLSTNSGTSWTSINGTGLLLAQFYGFDLPYDGINEKIIVGVQDAGSWRFANNEWGNITGGDGGWTLTNRLDKTKTIIRNNNGWTIYNNIAGTLSGMVAPGGWKLGEKYYLHPQTQDVIYGTKDLLEYNYSTKNWSTLWDNPQSDADLTRISAVGISHDGNNTMYIAYEDGYHNSNANPSNIPRYKLYKVQGTTTTDITNVPILSQALEWRHITNIVVDPANPNVVYVATGGFAPLGGTSCDAFQKVLKSTDGGQSWTDISTGLLAVPINDMVYQEGTNGILFVATDAGVYRYDPQVGQWECFNRDFTVSVVTKLQIDPCLGKIYASTFGKGLWMADLPEATTQGAGEVTISQNESWSGSRLMGSDIRITNGAQLTLSGKLVFNGTDNRIYIEPGSQLTLTGEITSSCGQWGGIHVIGSSDPEQSYAKHGRLVINGGSLSNARDAITNYEPGSGSDWYAPNSMGGIIEVSGAAFTNNRRDVALASYHREDPSGDPLPYRASFTNCTFERNNDFRIETMLSSISMWDVEGVVIKGCSFTNNHTSGFQHAGGGLFTVDATYRVEKNGSTGCTFSKYADAIRSQNNVLAQMNYPIRITGNTFTENIHSVYLGNTQGAKVAHNNISIAESPGGYSPPNPNTFQPAYYGIYMDYSNLFQLHDNTLASSLEFEEEHVGIVVKDNSGESDQVYKNHIDGFRWALQGIGTNRSQNDPKQGINFICNDLGFSADNATDIRIGSGAVAEIQGFYASGNIANNLFSSASSTHISNNGDPIIYNYGQGSTRAVPNNISAGVTILPIAEPVDYLGKCPDRPLAPQVTNPTTTLGGIYALEADIADDRDLLEQLIDEGSTPALEAQILFAADQEDYQDLYEDLMYMAPYVSEENLLNLVEIQDYPELALRNIMVANPHGARDEAVWEALVNREPALSQQSLDDIENERQTVTAKDVLEADIAGQELESHRLSLQLLDFYTEQNVNSGDGSQAEAIRTHLKYRDEPHFRYALIDMYLGKEDLSTAAAELTAMAAECEMGDFEVAEYASMQEYYTVVSTAINEEVGMDALEGDALNTLADIVENGTGTAVGRARTLLRLNGEEAEYIEPILDDGQGKKAADYRTTERPLQPSSSFKLYPNPAGAHTVLQWNWLEAGLTEGFRVVLRDLNGKLLQSLEVRDAKRNILLIQTHELSPGLYLLSVERGDKRFYTEKLTIE